MTTHSQRALILYRRRRSINHLLTYLRGDAYLNERSVVFNEEMVGGRERVTTDEERVLRGG